MLLGYCTPQPYFLFYSPQNQENRLYIHDTSVKTVVQKPSPTISKKKKKPSPTRQNMRFMLSLK